jgi:hypothetical protein
VSSALRSSADGWHDHEVADKDTRRDAPVRVTALVLAIVGSIALCLIVLTAARFVWHFLLDAMHSMS